MPVREAGELLVEEQEHGVAAGRKSRKALNRDVPGRTAPARFVPWREASWKPVFVPTVGSSETVRPGEIGCDEHGAAKLDARNFAVGAKSTPCSTWTITNVPGRSLCDYRLEPGRSSIDQRFVPTYSWAACVSPLV